jgi:hypothetical protein
MSDVLSLELKGRRFTTMPRTRKLPSGRYVAHEGAFFPVKAASRNAPEAYPLRVLIDAAAECANQAVIVPQAEQIVVGISGTDRIFTLDASHRHGIHRALVRLTTGLNVNEVVVIGQMEDDFPFPVVCRSFAEIKLPPVLDSRRTWRVISLMGLVFALILALAPLLKAQSAIQIAAAERENGQAMVQLDDLMAQVKENRKTLGGVAAPEQGSVASDSQPVPIIRQSFIELLEKGTKTFKVKDGKVE